MILDVLLITIEKGEKSLLNYVRTFITSMNKKFKQNVDPSYMLVFPKCLVDFDPDH